MLCRMNNLARSPLLCLAFVSAGCVAVSVQAQTPPAPSTLSCTIGPANKVYGKSNWLVYGCDDGRGVVIVSAPGSPAMPFVFSIVFGPKGMQLHGEGAGNQDATDAAYSELKSFTEKDIAALYQEAKAQRSPELD